MKNQIKLSNPSTLWLIAMIMITCMVATYIITLHSGHYWGGDEAQYIHHALNLLDGKPYADTGYIYNPDMPKVGPRQYPPGYPLLLIPVVGLFGTNLAILKIYNIFLYAISLVIFFAILQEDKERDDWYNLLILALVIVNPFLWEAKELVYSEFAFMLWMMLSLWILRRLDNNSDPIPCLLYVLAGLAMYFTYATRTIGVVLMLAMWISDLTRHRKLTQKLRCVSVVFFVCMLIHTLILPSDASYFDSLTEISPLNLYFPVWYLYGFISGLQAISMSVPQIIYVLVAGVLILSRFITSIRERITYINALIPMYFCILCIWTSFQWRFLVPLLPWSMVFLTDGMIDMVTFLQKRWQNSWILVPVMIALVGLTLQQEYVLRYKGRDLDASRDPDSSTELYTWIRSETDADAVFVFYKPRILSLYADRDAAAYYLASTDALTWTYYESINAKYFISAPAIQDTEEWPQFLKRSNEHLALVFSNDDFQVYEYIP